MDKDVKSEVVLVSKKVEVEPSLQSVKELPSPPRRNKATAEGLTTSEGCDQREASQKVSDVTVSPLSPGESGSHGEESLPEALTVGTTSC